MSDNGKVELQKEIRDQTDKALEKLASGVIHPKIPVNFFEIQKEANDLLYILEERKQQGFEVQLDDNGKKVVDDKIISRSWQIVEELMIISGKGFSAEEGGALSLLPDEIVVAYGEGAEKRNKLLINLAGGEKIETNEGKEVPLREIISLGIEAQSSKLALNKDVTTEEWKNKDNEKLWYSISEQQRERTIRMLELWQVMGLSTSALARGEIGAVGYRQKYVDSKTGEEIELLSGEKLTFDPIKETMVLSDINTGEKVVLDKKIDSKPEKFINPEDPDGSYIKFKRSGKEIVARVKKVPDFSNPLMATTNKGRRLISEKVEIVNEVIPGTKEMGQRERPLRKVLSELTAQKAAFLADNLLTTLQYNLDLIGFQDSGDIRGIIIEGQAVGAEKYDAFINSLNNENLYKKWRAIANFNEWNDMFVMFMGAKQRGEALKGEAGARFAKLASGDNIADWIEYIPGLAEIMSWKEWKGLKHPFSGDKLDYPAVRFDENLRSVLKQRIEEKKVTKIITADGKRELNKEEVQNYQPKDGDIFIISAKEGSTPHEEMISLMQEKAKNLGIEPYVPELAFCFHRGFFMGPEIMISYMKARLPGPILGLTDILGFGEQIREDYQKMTPQDKEDFERFVKEVGVFQTGVESYFNIVWGLDDGTPINQDNRFIRAWLNRAPVYNKPEDPIFSRVSWGKDVNWGKEIAKREIYRWMAEFSTTIGMKSKLSDMTGKYAGRGAPFDVENQYHLDALVEYLIKQGSNPDLGLELKEFGADINEQKRGLQRTIRKIFEDKEFGSSKVNFLGELDKFNKEYGFEESLRATEQDFDSVTEEYRLAVKLEKALEQPGFFGNLLEFTEKDGTTPNMGIIQKIRSGRVNQNSYDRLVYKALYYYDNYSAFLANFMRRRLRKEPFNMKILKEGMLPKYMDQVSHDVLGTPYDSMLTFANEQEDISIRSGIERGKIGHEEIERRYKEDRLWRDVMLWYQDPPSLDPEEHHKLVNEYCKQRLLSLHVAVDEYYLKALRDKTLGLRDVKELTEKYGKDKLFNYGFRMPSGKFIGRISADEELSGKEKIIFNQMSRMAKGEFNTDASWVEFEMQLAKMMKFSTYSSKEDMEIMMKDVEGLFLNEIRRTWYGVVENSVYLSSQVEVWHKELQEINPQDWEFDEEYGLYIGIPEILIGYAREYLSLDITANSEDGARGREFLKDFLYIKTRNQDLNQENWTLNDKGFQILIAQMFAKDSEGDMPRMRWVYMYTYIMPLVGTINNGREGSDNFERYLGFYDDLMSEKREDGKTWKEFFREKDGGRDLDKKETIRHKMASLLARDRIFSPELSPVASEVIKNILGMEYGPSEDEFNMIDEVTEWLEKQMDSRGTRTGSKMIDNIMSDLAAGGVGGNIRNVNKFLIKKHGVSILRGLNIFSNKIVTSDEVVEILRHRLPDTLQARRLVYMNFGVDLGKSVNMNELMGKIQEKVPGEWEGLYKILVKRKLYSFAEPERWLNGSFFSRPNSERAHGHFSRLVNNVNRYKGYEKYTGIIFQARHTAYENLLADTLTLLMDQFAWDDKGKTKYYLELKMKCAEKGFSWEYLERYVDEVFGMGKRPIDFRTDFQLSLEHSPGPDPLLLIPWALGKFKALQPMVKPIDAWLKKFWVPPIGAFVPAGLITLGAVLAMSAALPGWGVVGAGYGVYLASGHLVRLGIHRYNKYCEGKGLIDNMPKIPFLVKKEII